MTIIATIAYSYLPYLSAFNVSLSDTSPQKSSISSQQINAHQFFTPEGKINISCSIINDDKVSL